MPRNRTQSLPMLVMIALLFVLALLPHGWLGWTNSFHHLVAALVAPVSDPFYRMASSLRPREDLPIALDGDAEQVRAEFEVLIDQLRQKDGRIIALEYELQRIERELAALQGLQADLAATAVAPLRAGVVARNADLSGRTLTINRGSRNGVKVGFPVVDGSLLVGRVIDVALATATVNLVTSPGKQYMAIITPRELPLEGLPFNRQGVCLFQVTGPRRLEAVVSKDFPVEVGELAHLRDDDWPDSVQGRILGEVIAVEPFPQQPLLRNRIVIEPTRPIDRLDRVIVIVPREFLSQPGAGSGNALGGESGRSGGGGGG